MKHIISILFICLSNMTSQAQNSPSDLNRKFVNYLTSSLSESIYLQTDKPYYTTEDTIWLKAYVVNAQIYQPSPSNFVYRIDQSTRQRGKEDKNPKRKQCFFRIFSP